MTVVWTMLYLLPGIPIAYLSMVRGLLPNNPASDGIDYVGVGVAAVFFVAAWPLVALLSSLHLLGKYLQAKAK